MALPQSRESRQFYRAGLQRFEDAQCLLRSEVRTTGAIYLAGYGVECLLKSLVLSHVPVSQQPDVASTFRGRRAHNFDWLKERYYQLQGSHFPPEISRSFTLVNTWGTEWRYRSGLAAPREAERFLQAADEIIQWVDGRL